MKFFTTLLSNNSLLLKTCIRENNLKLFKKTDYIITKYRKTQFNLILNHCEYPFSRQKKYLLRKVG